jgi:hypothetical protein
VASGDRARPSSSASLSREGDIEVIVERSLLAGMKDRNPDLYRKYNEVKMRNDPGHYLRSWRPWSKS